jgi:hypothetical protein
MRRKIIRWSLLALSAALAASCVMVMDSERGQSWPTTPEFRRSVGLAAGGTVAIEHTLGNITITGWDKDTAEIVAKAGEEATEVGGRVRVYPTDELEPLIDVRGDGTGLRIRTKSLGGPWSSGGLDYVIQLPRSVNIDPLRLERGNISVAGVYGRMVIDLGAGNLKVDNFSGPLKASVDSGSADIELLDVRAEDVADITVAEGDIVLRLQADADVWIDAAAPRGEITSDLKLGQPLPARTLSSRLGGGQARIVLRALRGNIQILRTE